MSKEKTLGGNRGQLSEPMEVADTMTIPSNAIGSTSPVQGSPITQLKFREPTITEVADAERFAEFTVDVRMSHKDAPVHFVNHENDPRYAYRFCGFLLIMPRIKTIRVQLRPGATIRDRDRMLFEAERVKSGFGFQMPFVVRLSEKYPDKVTYSLDYGYGVLRGAPRGRGSELLVPCTTEGCKTFGNFHEAQHAEDVRHLAETLEGPADDDYTIEVQRFEGEQWNLNILVEALSVEQVPGFVSDLRWAAAECGRRNTAAVSDGRE